MFNNLSQRLNAVFENLTRQAVLRDEHIKTALKEIRRALLEADVALEAIKALTEKIQQKASGAKIVKSVTPGQMVIKIVHDEIAAILANNAEPINLKTTPPTCIMMVGLQGSGKTTTTAKLAKHLHDKEKKKVLMASLDINRPAAQLQLKQLGEQINIDTLPIIEGQDAKQITTRATQAAQISGYDILLLDTAGRTHIDETLMMEMAEIKTAANPHEILLVADSLTGQDAVHIARTFNERIEINGIILTRIDSDTRGGAALSMQFITNKPIKMMGTGEKITDLEIFHPTRIAERILGKGDVVSLVEKAAETINEEQAKSMNLRMKKGLFDLNDLAEQLKQMNKMGGMQSIIGMIPGMKKLKPQTNNLNDDAFTKQMAIISSMTKKERQVPKILNASRKKRISAGAGASIQEINKLLKMHRQMSDMMKKMATQKGAGLMQQMAQQMGLGNMAGNMGGGGNIDMGNLANINMPNMPTNKLPGLGAPLNNK